MNWRWFQGGFIIGVALGVWSMVEGATAIVTLSDIAAGGLIYGVFFEAIWAISKSEQEIKRRISELNKQPEKLRRTPTEQE